MKIIGGTADGAVAFTTDLEHGVDPGVLAYERGFFVERPLSAEREHGELVLRLAVRPVAGEPRPAPVPQRTDPGLVLEAGMVPVIRQRVAAYAVIRSHRGDCWRPSTRPEPRWRGGGACPAAAWTITRNRPTACCAR